MKILLVQYARGLFFRPRQLLFRTIASVMVFLFGANMVLVPLSFAQVAFLPSAGSMVNMTPKFDPMVVKGIKLYPDNPFKFDFIVDTGDIPLSQEQIKTQGQKLASYFLASLTTPEKEMWVNLSPYEKSRIIPTAFGDTEMGKELLSEDYMLKQIMATALYPERQLGQEFWQRVYAQAQREFGTTNVPVSTFNKVWIVPNDAIVYENAKLNSVFVVQSSLKVMLEQDYLAANKHKAMEQYGMSQESLQAKTTSDAVSAMSSRIIKEIVIPALEREVNTGKNFAGLRQVYQSLILAAWYKKNLKDNVLAKGYVDRNKTKGVDTQDKQIIEKIYKQYLKAYRKGVYNYIKEEVDPATQQIIPRKYFSGGAYFAMIINDLQNANPAQVAQLDSAMNDGAKLGRLAWIRVFVLAVGIPLALALPAVAQQPSATQPAPVAEKPPEQLRPVPPALSSKEITLEDYIQQRNMHRIPEGMPFEEYLKQFYKHIPQKPPVTSVGPGHGASQTAPAQRTPKEMSVEEIRNQITRNQVEGVILSTNKNGVLVVKQAGIKGEIPVSHVLRFVVGDDGQLYVLSWNNAEITKNKFVFEIDRINRKAAGQINRNEVPQEVKDYFDKAMSIGQVSLRLNPPIERAMYGGIDLEKLILNTKGSGGVRTAFSDPRILQLLLEAKGLFPQILSIEPVTVPMINMLLGFKTPANDKNPAANDNNPVNAPAKQSDSQPSFLKAALIDIRNKNSIYC